MLVEPPDFRRAVALAVIALQLGERVFRIRQGHRVDGDRSLAALIHIGHGQAFQTVRSDSDTPPNSSLDWAAALVSAFALASMAFARRERASPYCCLFSRRQIGRASCRASVCKYV